MKLGNGGELVSQAHHLFRGGAGVGYISFFQIAENLGIVFQKGNFLVDTGRKKDSKFFALSLDAPVKSPIWAPLALDSKEC